MISTDTSIQLTVDAGTVVKIKKNLNIHGWDLIPYDIIIDVKNIPVDLRASIINFLMCQ